MKPVWLVSFLLFSLNARAFEPSVEIIERFDDVRVVAFVSEADLKNYPLWHPTGDTLPLSVGEAIAAVVKKRNGHHHEVSDIEEIELRKISGRKDHWHYLVKLAAGSSQGRGLEVYVVLMTGKVIPAIIEPEAVK